MNSFSKILGIFLTPHKTFESLNRNPTWIVPFLIISIVAIILSYFVMDIAIHDQLSELDVQTFSQEKQDIIKANFTGSINYLQILIVPIWYLLIWGISAGFISFAGNIITEGNVPFKKIYSIVAWSSFIAIFGEILKTATILCKGTTEGVTMSLAAILPIQEIYQNSTFIYHILSKFDIFIIWMLVLWIIGISILYRYPIKKSVKLVLSLWIIWIVISVTFFRSEFWHLIFHY